ncbi:hypothetical protein M1S95_22810, partial [Providencia rettgeri]|nr:hypothetical protein [Providencia rettgeri]
MTYSKPVDENDGEYPANPPDGFQPPVISALNIMREVVIAEVSTQLSEVVGVIERHLEPTLLAVHLYGSAVDGGLKPHS